MQLLCSRFGAYLPSVLCWVDNTFSVLCRQTPSSLLGVCTGVQYSEYIQLTRVGYKNNGVIKIILRTTGYLRLVLYSYTLTGSTSCIRNSVYSTHLVDAHIVPTEYTTWEVPSPTMLLVVEVVVVGP
jgi:uncharacterized membrane protein